MKTPGWRGWVLASVSGLFAAPAARAVELVDWALVDAACAGAVDAALRVPCGSYGTFVFEVADDGGCEAAADGVETPIPYPHPAGATLIPVEPGPLLPHGGGRRLAAARRAQAPVQLLVAPWVAVIDWADDHGESVVGLIELLAAGHAGVELYPLNGPDLGALGPQVGDPHVLARLCSVVEDAEGPGTVAPLAVNLSFGRFAQSGESGDAASCDSTRLACQIARVLAHLRGLGTLPVAAAGNHQSLLFPASLEEVLAAAPMDVTWFLASQLSVALWQAPAEVDVVLPGHALCVGGAAVPAGSSYASAFFSGWYAFVASAQVPNDPFLGPWGPAWSAVQSCYVLAQPGKLHGGCNPGLAPAVAGIVLGSASGCWVEPEEGGEPLAVAGPPGPPLPQPQVPSFDEWSAQQQHPAPEADPCIPCVGGGGGYTGLTSLAQRSAGDIVLNLTASVALDSALHLKEVHLRVGDAFYLVDLSAADLEAMERGELGGLALPGYGALLRSPTQPSLLYVFTVAPALPCNAARCFWTSTPVLLP